MVYTFVWPRLASGLKA